MGKKGHYRLRTWSAPYNPPLEFWCVCHLRCIPPLHAGDGFTTSGYIIVSREEVDDEELLKTPCLFCGK